MLNTYHRRSKVASGIDVTCGPRIRPSGDNVVALALDKQGRAGGSMTGGRKGWRLAATATASSVNCSVTFMDGAGVAGSALKRGCIKIGVARCSMALPCRGLHCGCGGGSSGMDVIFVLRLALLLQHGFFAGWT